MDNNNPLMISGIEFPDIPKLRSAGKVSIYTKTPLPLMHRSYTSPVLSAVAAVVLGKRTLLRSISLRTYLYNTAPKDFTINTDDLENPALVKEILANIGKNTDTIEFDDIMDIVRNHREYARRLYNLRTIDDINKDLYAVENGAMAPPTASYDYLLHEITRYVWTPSNGGEVDTTNNNRSMQYLMASHDIVNNVGLVVDDIIETYDIYRIVAEQVSNIILPKTEVLMDLIVTSPTAAMELINTSNAIETMHGSKIDGHSFWDIHNNGTTRAYSAENELVFLERARINPSGSEMLSIIQMTGSPKKAGEWLVNRVDEISTLTSSRLDFNKLVHQQASQLKGYSNWTTLIYNGTFLSLNDVLGTTWEVDILGIFDV